jgi:hypothetical protein
VQNLKIAVERHKIVYDKHDIPILERKNDINTNMLTGKKM